MLTNAENDLKYDLEKDSVIGQYMIQPKPNETPLQWGKILHEKKRKELS